MNTTTPKVEGYQTAQNHGIGVGIDLDYEMINNMLMVSASGATVRLG